MAYNKVVFANETLIDLTSDTVQASDVQSGKYYTGPDGVRRQGTSTKDANTTDADALASNILYGQTAYAQGNKITGSMANQGSITRTIGTKDGYAVIPGGYHDGGGKISIASTEQAKIVPGNIKSGSVIMGVTGTYTGEDPIIQENKSIGAEVTDETIDITPDDGYEGMEQVTIYPITYELTPNAAGGNTCTIVDGEVPTPGPDYPSTSYDMFAEFPVVDGGLATKEYWNGTQWKTITQYVDAYDFTFTEDGVKKAKIRLKGGTGSYVDTRQPSTDLSTFMSDPIPGIMEGGQGSVWAGINVSDIIHQCWQYAYQDGDYYIFELVNSDVVPSGGGPRTVEIYLKTRSSLS